MEESFEMQNKLSNRRERDIQGRETREDGRWIVETKVENTEIDHELISCGRTYAF